MVDGRGDGRGGTAHKHLLLGAGDRRPLLAVLGGPSTRLAHATANRQQRSLAGGVNGRGGLLVLSLLASKAP
jgi:hypothetical protein